MLSALDVACIVTMRLSFFFRLAGNLCQFSSLSSRSRQDRLMSLCTRAILLCSRFLFHSICHSFRHFTGLFFVSVRANCAIATRFICRSYNNFHLMWICCFPYLIHWLQLKEKKKKSIKQRSKPHRPIKFSETKISNLHSCDYLFACDVFVFFFCCCSFSSFFLQNRVIVFSFSFAKPF